MDTAFKIFWRWTQTLALARTYETLLRQPMMGIYVILDIILNHAGDVFEYVGGGKQ